MTDRIRKICAGLAEIAAWKLSIIEKESAELFYVGKLLETNRASDIRSCELTIYVDDNDKRGSAVFTVADHMSDDELTEKIKDNIYAAKFALNPRYDIPSPADTVLPESRSNLREMTLQEAAEKTARAVFKADTYEDGFLSATEIFIEKKTVRLVNSKGVDLSSVSCSGQVELIPSFEKNGEEAEIYHMLRFESLHEDEITEKVDEQLRIAQARFTARPLGEVIDMTQPVKVLIQDRDAGEVLYYFADDLDYAAKYQKANKFELGDPVQGDSVSGSLLTLTMKPYVENAFASAFFDADGVVLHDTLIVKDGIAVGRYGSYRYGCYLGEKKPAGHLPIITVEPGTKSFSEMAKEPYLRCLVFSGIQVEGNSGYFGGEVRLGYYFDGEKEIPVTGFSISGDMNVSRGTMVFSKETVTTGAYSGPKYLEIPDMKLA